MLDGLEPLGVVGLGILPGPLRKPLGVSRPRAPGGLPRSKTIALTRSQVAERRCSALGARGARRSRPPAPIDGYDGVEQQITAIAGNGYDSSASRLTANVTLWPRPLVLFMNPKALQRSATTSGTPSGRRASGASGHARRRRRGGQGGGGDPLPPRREVRDRDRRRPRSAPARGAARLRPPRARRGRRRLRSRSIRGLSTALAAPPDAPACSGRAPGRPRRPGDTGCQVHAARRRLPIDDHARGVSEVGRRAGGGHGLGELRAVAVRVRPGRLRYTQASEGNRRWTRADYTRQGSRPDHDDHRLGRRGAQRRGREDRRGFTYRWSLYRDRLTLGPVAGRGLAPAWFIKPWRRVGDAP